MDSIEIRKDENLTYLTTFRLHFVMTLQRVFIRAIFQLAIRKQSTLLIFNYAFFLAFSSLLRYSEGITPNIFLKEDEKLRAVAKPT